MVGPIRAASRELVRELGFMNSTLAGTSHSAAAVHILIELGYGSPKSVVELSDTLNLNTVSVTRALHDLTVAGEVAEATASTYDDTSVYSLTSQGHRTLSEINEFAQDQVTHALELIHLSDTDAIRHGLQLYSTCLRSQRTGQTEKLSDKIRILRGYRPGLISRTLQMHMDFYSRTAGFGLHFETQLAKGLSDLVARLSDPRNAVWTAVMDEQIVGTVYIDGQGMGSNRAHLRAFIVDDRIRGGGVGRRLLAEAVAFTEEQGFSETHLWTFQGLHAARRLYESVGFALEKEAKGTQWGEQVVEQLFVRRPHVT